MLFFLLAASCQPETGITEGEPELIVEVDELDFDEVVIGAQVTLTFELQNDGIGVLELDPVLSTGTSERYTVTSYPSEVDPRSTSEISVRLAPDELGEVSGVLELHSNDPDNPLVEVDLVGEGVEPHIDVDPETLWFGDIALGGSSTLPVDIVARGQGRLRIDTLELEDEAGVFSFSTDVELPHKLDSGTGIALDVTFEPTDEEPAEGNLLIATNDPDDPVVAVRLLGNTEEVGAPPSVEITRPDWGNYFIEGEVVSLEGIAVDDGGPDDLLVAWYADGSLLGTSVPDGSDVSLETDLPAGDLTITLRALDGTGQSAEDTVDVTVWEQDEPTLYTLAGGPSIFDHWAVDDDVAVYLDGTLVYSDTSESRSTHAPLAIDARVGQTLRVVATDHNYCEKYLDALVLHWGTDAQQELNDEICVSSCPEDACYDPDYGGPWPNDFFDESWVISIP